MVLHALPLRQGTLLVTVHALLRVVQTRYPTFQREVGGWRRSVCQIPAGQSRKPACSHHQCGFLVSFLTPVEGADYIKYFYSSHLYCSISILSFSHYLPAHCYFLFLTSLSPNLSSTLNKYRWKKFHPKRKKKFKEHQKTKIQNWRYNKKYQYRYCTYNYNNFLYTIKYCFQEPALHDNNTNPLHEIIEVLIASMVHEDMTDGLHQPWPSFRVTEGHKPCQQKHVWVVSRGQVRITYIVRLCSVFQIRIKYNASLS